MAVKEKNRCSWCLKDDIYKTYHDEVWGVPVYDDRELFEFLNLEGAQAGLSWYSILVRIDGYKKAFKNWDIKAISKMKEKDVERLMKDTGIIRNKLKINAVITNAQAYLELKKEQSLSDFLWDYVDGQPIINKYKKPSDSPAQTELSTQISKDLKKRGFKFVGPTIMYAYMQAVGMVDDHVVSCWKRKSNSKNKK